MLDVNLVVGASLEVNWLQWLHPAVSTGLKIMYK